MKHDDELGDQLFNKYQSNGQNSVGWGVILKFNFRMSNFRMDNQPTLFFTGLFFRKFGQQLQIILLRVLLMRKI